LFKIKVHSERGGFFYVQDFDWSSRPSRWEFLVGAVLVYSQVIRLLQPKSSCPQSGPLTFKFVNINLTIKIWLVLQINLYLYPNQKKYISMNNILNVNKETSTDIEFIINNGKLVSSKSVFGDESPMLLEVIFLYLLRENYIPLSYMEGEVKMTLTDSDTDSEVPSFDILFYRDDEQDEDETPIFLLDEGLISDIKTTLTLCVIDSVIEEKIEKVNNHINSVEFRNELKEVLESVGLNITYDDNLPIFKIEFDSKLTNDINSHISW
jgi:hypothetical protein